MILDINVIERFYNELGNKITNIKKTAGRPLTLSEKILFSHLFRIVL